MTIRINDSVEITGDEDYNFERHPDEGYLTRLLNRREKQLKRVIKSARNWRRMADERDKVILALDDVMSWGNQLEGI